MLLLLEDDVNLSTLLPFWNETILDIIYNIGYQIVSGTLLIYFHLISKVIETFENLDFIPFDTGCKLVLDVVDYIINLGWKTSYMIFFY